MRVSREIGPCWFKNNYQFIVLDSNKLVIFTYNPKTKTMSKGLIIEQAKSILIKRGFKEPYFIFSLQGPTVIFTEEGLKKYEEDQRIREELLNLGVKIL
jgi:hypothetical protein